MAVDWNRMNVTHPPCQNMLNLLFLNDCQHDVKTRYLSLQLPFRPIYFPRRAQLGFCGYASRAHREKLTRRHPRRNNKEALHYELHLHSSHRGGRKTIHFEAHSHSGVSFSSPSLSFIHSRIKVWHCAGCQNCDLAVPLMLTDRLWCRRGDKFKYMSAVFRFCRRQFSLWTARFDSIAKKKKKNTAYVPKQTTVCKSTRIFCTTAHK